MRASRHTRRAILAATGLASAAPALAAGPVDVIPIAPTDRDPGEIVARFAAALRPTTRVISVSHVISATGHAMPVAEIAALARSRGVVCVVDGAQAWGQIPVDVRAIGCHA